MMQRALDLLCFAALTALMLWLFPWEPSATLQNQLLEWSDLGRQPYAER